MGGPAQQQRQLQLQLQQQPGHSHDTSLQRLRRVMVAMSIASVLGFILYLQLCLLPRHFSRPEPGKEALRRFYVNRLEAGLQKCADWNTKPIEYAFPISSARPNPRWNPKSGQNDTILLRNATLFDGEDFLDGPVDILFAGGIIKSVSSTSASIYDLKKIKLYEMEGRFVTPGLVDMHSHHSVMPWPDMPSTDDGNEISTTIGAPLTPFLRVMDSIKAWDPAIITVASGGVTSSLLLPGSANIMGGEGVMIKNVPNGGTAKETVVSELLLEHGVPKEERRRYMKMACGENPKGTYLHTRMGDAWILRQHLARSQDLKDKQDAWCLSATAAREAYDVETIETLVKERADIDGGLAKELELDSTVAMLRGKIGVNIHCYESQDFEDMLLHSREFGFQIQAFHHALDAWKVPEMLKSSAQNITVATFSEFGLMKHEAYGSNLWAGKILSNHGVPVAYKSDHSIGELSAKYLIFQAATAHSFQLPEILALQSVTSVPARSVKMDHRIGYAREGYDADIVVWDSHPLSVGATPLQVYIDGKATLDPTTVAKSLAKKSQSSAKIPSDKQERIKLAEDVRSENCAAIEEPGTKIIITGISKSYLDTSADNSNFSGNLTMVLEAGRITCFAPGDSCLSAGSGGIIVTLKNGHVLPGLTAVSVSLGLTEMALADWAGDGEVMSKKDPTNPSNVIYAKYGIHLDGKAFGRARIGGITKAITAPMTGFGGIAFLGGVSVGIETSGRRGILDGGIFKEDVALHFVIGQASKTDSTPTISSAIGKLREILWDNNGKDNIFGRAANGSLPLIVTADNEYDILQLVKLKLDFSSQFANSKPLNLILHGGTGAVHVATSLANASIPVILTGARGASDSFEKRNTLPGPPLSISPAQVLAEAGVKFGIATTGFTDSHIHNLLIEASWAAKYAGLGDNEAVSLVSRNIEEILGLEDGGDVVIYEGNPLEFGATVVLAVGKEGGVKMCWPEAE